MRIIKIGFSFVALLVSHQVFAWGLIGHRVVAEIAERHLSSRAKAQVKILLGAQSLADISSWADDLRSDPAKDFLKPMHYVSVPDGSTYEESPKDPQGDVIVAIKKYTAQLKDKKASRETRAEALKLLVHFVGDIHQPLHVGRAEDRGGNSVQVFFFGQPSNLHSVWDDGVIDSMKLGYTEWVTSLDRAIAKDIKAWQSHSVEDWARESAGLRPLVYNFSPLYPAKLNESTPSFAAEEKDEKSKLPKLSYDYRLRALPIIQVRLMQAGIRLAGVLNSSL